MNIVILGPQGSGKGTQAKLLVDKFNFDYFESGEYLRRIANENEILRKMLDEGAMVPDLELTSYLTAYLDQESLYDNLLLDGFPRNLEQYNFLKTWLNEKQVKIDLVLVLEISKEETLNRLMKRKREDDTPEAIEERLSLYNSRTEPLIEELEKDSKVVKVNGERSVEAIFEELCTVVEKTKNEQNNN